MSARRSLLSIAAAFAAVATATAARATDALNSSEKSGTGTKVIYGDEAAEKTEFNLLPVGGGTTDIGVGGGFFANYAVVKAGYDPYIWEIESAGLVTLKYTDNQVIFPYQDVYVKLTIPRLFGLPLRFEVRPEYSWETTLGYYGLGNASSATAPQGAPNKYFQYGRLHPELVADLRWRILDHVGGRAGLTYTENWNQIASNSKLANDLQNGSPEVKS
ncbi:MAG TPA: hypothetical protein VK841_16770, partial [Polyangiaceae bacterium]|nr:hypothetical protein [Polyangiaceae bacterium]